MKQGIVYCYWMRWAKQKFIQVRLFLKLQNKQIFSLSNILDLRLICSILLFYDLILLSLKESISISQIAINQYIFNYTHIQIDHITQMGTQCTKPAKQQNRPPKRCYSETKINPISHLPLKQRQETFLTIYSIASATKKDLENFHIYQKKLDDKTMKEWIKYSEKEGSFFDFQPSLSSYRQSPHHNQNHQEFVFFVQKSQLGNFFLEVKGHKVKLYKKIREKLMELVERDQILMGNLQVKLQYWLTPEETLHLKKKKQIKLNTCKDSNAECRICLENNYDPQNNPLIEPCRCSGSTRAIHQRCLSRWIFGTPAPFQQQLDSYTININNYICQICKKSFTDYIWSRIISIVASFSGYYAIFQIDSVPGATRQSNPSFFILKFTNEQQVLKVPQFGKLVGDLKIIRSGKVLMIEDNSAKRQLYISSETPYICLGEQYRIGNVKLHLERR